MCLEGGLEWNTKDKWLLLFSNDLTCTSLGHCDSWNKLGHVDKVWGVDMTGMWKRPSGLRCLPPSP